eukprot:6405627-Amphidinium_carterae.1
MHECSGNLYRKLQNYAHAVEPQELPLTIRPKRCKTPATRQCSHAETHKVVHRVQIITVLPTTMKMMMMMMMMLMMMMLMMMRDDDGGKEGRLVRNPYRSRRKCKNKSTSRPLHRAQHVSSQCSGSSCQILKGLTLLFTSRVTTLFGSVLK